MSDIYITTRTGYAVIDPDDNAPEARCSGPAYPNAPGCGRFLATRAGMCERCRTASDEYWSNDLRQEMEEQRLHQAHGAPLHNDFPF